MYSLMKRDIGMLLDCKVATAVSQIQLVVWSYYIFHHSF